MLAPSCRVSALEVVRKVISWHIKKPEEIWGHEEEKFHPKVQIQQVEIWHKEVLGLGFKLSG